MPDAFDTAWNVVKEEHKNKEMEERRMMIPEFDRPSSEEMIRGAPSMKDIIDAAEDRARLVQMIQMLDDRGLAMSGERMAVDLLLNHGVSPERVKRRMMMLSDNRGDEPGVFMDPDFGGRETNMSYFMGDPPYFG
tara:strand:+ start:35 stop:439 length:405 start_codon:yes stop_codon:yes gene_type:complete